MSGGAVNISVPAVVATLLLTSNAPVVGPIDVTSPVGIPDHFTLIADGSHLPCHVIWRKEKRIGIAFD